MNRVLLKREKPYKALSKIVRKKSVRLVLRTLCGFHSCVSNCTASNLFSERFMFSFYKQKQILQKFFQKLEVFNICILCWISISAKNISLELINL